jgi:hypothetical protein
MVTTATGSGTTPMPKFHNVEPTMSKNQLRPVEGVRPDGQPAETGWKAILQAIINKHAGTRVNGNVASHRTKEHNSIVLEAGMKLLHGDLGMHIQNPYNIGERHIARMVHHWWYEQKKAPKTIAGDLSVWRKFATWIGKEGMVKKLADYLPDVPPDDLRIKSKKEVSPSWAEAGIDVEAKIQEAFRVDDRFGYLLMSQLAFGLRMQEALCLKPHKADHGNGLKVYGSDGAKNGRDRFLEIRCVEQRMVLNMLKQVTTKRGRLGWSKNAYGREATLESNIDHYYYCLRKIGITKELSNVCGHGLRAQFTEDGMMLKGMLPATLGGTADQMPKEDQDRILAQLSEDLGHSRIQILGAYVGGMARARQEKKAAEAAKRVAPSEPENTVLGVPANPAASVATGNELSDGCPERPQSSSSGVAPESPQSSTKAERSTGKSKVLDARQGKLPLDEPLSWFRGRRKK